MEPFVTRIGDVTIERVLPKSDRPGAKDRKESLGSPAAPKRGPGATESESIPVNEDLQIFIKPPSDAEFEKPSKDGENVDECLLDAQTAVPPKPSDISDMSTDGEETDNEESEMEGEEAEVDEKTKHDSDSEMKSSMEEPKSEHSLEMTESFGMCSENVEDPMPEGGEECANMNLHDDSRSTGPDGELCDSNKRKASDCSSLSPGVGGQKKKKSGNNGSKDGKQDSSSDSDDSQSGDSKTMVERKLSNMRRNIREVMSENQLDEETLAAQRQEMERLRRVQEQQRIIREVQRQIAMNRQNNKTQNRVISILQGNSSILKQIPGASGTGTQVKLPNTVLVKLSSPSSSSSTTTTTNTQGNKKKSLSSGRTISQSGVTRTLVGNKPRSAGQVHMMTPSVSIAPVSSSARQQQQLQQQQQQDFPTDSDSDDDYESDSEVARAAMRKVAGKPKGKDVVTISSSSDDDCILLSEPSSGDEEPVDDPTNSGMHTNDMYNIPDEQGRVLVNVGHPADEEDIFIAPQIARVIKPHQIGGVRFLFDNVVESVSRFNTSTGFGCILAHSMGLGKTLQVVCFCDVFLRHTSGRTVLCIMPINTLQNWMAEFNMWLPVEPECSNSPLMTHGEVRHRNFPLHVLNDSHKTMAARARVIRDWNKDGGVLLIGYELYRQLSLKRSNKTKKSKRRKSDELIDMEGGDEKNKVLLDDMHSALVKPGPDLVICDEGHRIKNSHASISQALKQIRSKRRVVLTGYPLQNNLLEYWCMVDFVRPNYLGTKTEFCNMFERPIQNGQCIDSTPQDIRLMRYRAHVLHSLLEGFVQRRSHSVLQVSLPQKEEYVLLLRMTQFQRKLYDTFMNEVVRTKAVPNPLKAFAVCCKIWNHPDILYYFLKKRNCGEDVDLDLEEATVAATPGTPVGAAGIGSPAKNIANMPKRPRGRAVKTPQPKKEKKPPAFRQTNCSKKPAATITPNTMNSLSDTTGSNLPGSNTPYTSPSNQGQGDMGQQNMHLDFQSQNQNFGMMQQQQTYDGARYPNMPSSYHQGSSNPPYDNPNYGQVSNPSGYNSNNYGGVGQYNSSGPYNSGPNPNNPNAPGYDNAGNPYYPNNSGNPQTNYGSSVRYTSYQGNNNQSGYHCNTNMNNTNSGYWQGNDYFPQNSQSQQNPNVGDQYYGASNTFNTSGNSSYYSNESFGEQMSSGAYNCPNTGIFQNVDTNSSMACSGSQNFIGNSGTEQNSPGNAGNVHQNNAPTNLDHSSSAHNMSKQGNVGNGSGKISQNTANRYNPTSLESNKPQENSPSEMNNADNSLGNQCGNLNNIYSGQQNQISGCSSAQQNLGNNQTNNQRISPGAQVNSAATSNNGNMQHNMENASQKNVCGMNNMLTQQQTLNSSGGGSQIPINTAMNPPQNSLTGLSGQHKGMNVNGQQNPVTPQQSHMNTISGQQNHMNATNAQQNSVNTMNEQHNPMNNMNAQQNPMNSMTSQQNIISVPSSQQQTMNMMNSQQSLMSIMNSQQNQMNIIDPQQDPMNIINVQQNPSNGINSQHNLISGMNVQHNPMNTQQNSMNNSMSAQHNSVNGVNAHQNPMNSMIASQDHINGMITQQNHMNSISSQQNSMNPNPMNHQDSVNPQQNSLNQHHSMNPHLSPMNPQHNPMNHQQNPINPQQNPMNSQQNPMNSPQNPMNPQQNPMNPQQNPMNPQQNPMNSQQNPINPQNPMNPQQNPINPQAPMNPQQNPMNPQQNSMNPQQNPMNQQQNLMNPQQNPMNLQQNPMNPQQNPMNPQQNPMNPQQNPMNPQQNPMNPQQNPMNPQHNPMNPQHNPMNPQQNPMNPQQNRLNPQQSPMNTQQNPMNSPQNPMNPQQNPMNPQQNPTNPQQNPTNPQQNPMNTQQNPMNTQQNPMNTQQNPMNTQQNPVNPQQNPINPQQNLMNPQQNPMNPHQNLMNPHQNLMNPHQNSMNSQQNCMNAQQNSMNGINGQQNPMNGMHTQHNPTNNMNAQQYSLNGIHTQQNLMSNINVQQGQNSITAHQNCANSMGMQQNVSTQQNSVNNLNTQQASGNSINGQQNVLNSMNTQQGSMSNMNPIQNPVNMNIQQNNSMNPMNMSSQASVNNGLAAHLNPMSNSPQNTINSYNLQQNSLNNLNKQQNSMSIQHNPMSNMTVHQDHMGHANAQQNAVSSVCVQQTSVSGMAGQQNCTNSVNVQNSMNTMNPQHDTRNVDYNSNNSLNSQQNLMNAQENSFNNVNSQQNPSNFSAQQNLANSSSPQSIMNNNVQQNSLNTSSQQNINSNIGNQQHSMNSMMMQQTPLHDQHTMSSQQNPLNSMNSQQVYMDQLNSQQNVANGSVSSHQNPLSACLNSHQSVSSDISSNQQKELNTTPTSMTNVENSIQQSTSINNPANDQHNSLANAGNPQVNNLSHTQDNVQHAQQNSGNSSNNSQNSAMGTSVTDKDSATLASMSNSSYVDNSQQNSMSSNIPSVMSNTHNNAVDHQNQLDGLPAISSSIPTSGENHNNLYAGSLNPYSNNFGQFVNTNYEMHNQSMGGGNLQNPMDNSNQNRGYNENLMGDISSNENVSCDQKGQLSSDSKPLSWDPNKQQYCVAETKDIMKCEPHADQNSEYKSTSTSIMNINNVEKNLDSTGTGNLSEFEASTNCETKVNKTEYEEISPTKLESNSLAQKVEESNSADEEKKNLIGLLNEADKESAVAQNQANGTDAMKTDCETKDACTGMYLDSVKKSCLPDGKQLVEVGTNPVRSNDPGIPYDWATELLKNYIPGSIENSAKMEVFFCILEESMALGDRLLVFSQSLFTLNLIEDFLQRSNVPGLEEKWARSVNYYRLDGSTSALEREKLINEYNSNPNIHLFLVSTRAGSLGINLVGANRVVVFDASWNPCHDTQAVCRVYRYGQKKPCFVYRLVMDNCLEKKIYDRQINKQGMADRVVDECNPDAHLSIKDVTNLCWDKEEDTEVKDFSKEKDKYIDVVMQKVLDKFSTCLSKEPFQHESLLVDRKEKKLSQAEKRLAKRSYELEKQASINYNRPQYSYYPAGGVGNAGVQSGLQIRAIRTDGTGGVMPKPIASVRPMQAELNSQMERGPGGQPRSTITTLNTGRSRWIPAEVWQRQGMSAQEMTLPLDVVIPTNSPDRASIVLKAGQRVMVLKSPKGIYMQLENGKIIAIRTAFKVGGAGKGSNMQEKVAMEKEGEIKPSDLKKDFNVSSNPPRTNTKVSNVLPFKNNSAITIIPKTATMTPGRSTPNRPANKMITINRQETGLKPWNTSCSSEPQGKMNMLAKQRLMGTKINQQPTGEARPYFHQQQGMRNKKMTVGGSQLTGMAKPFFHQDLQKNKMGTGVGSINARNHNIPPSNSDDTSSGAENMLTANEDKDDAVMRDVDSDKYQSMEFQDTGKYPRMPEDVEQDSEMSSEDAMPLGKDDGNFTCTSEEYSTRGRQDEQSLNPNFQSLREKPNWQQGDKSSWQQGEKSSWQQGDKPSWQQGDKPSWQQGDKPSWQQEDKPSWQHGEKQNWQQGDKPSWQHGEKPSWQPDDKPSWQQGDKPNWQHGEKQSWQQGDKSSWQQGDKPSWQQGSESLNFNAEGRRYQSEDKNWEEPIQRSVDPVQTFQNSGSKNNFTPEKVDWHDKTKSPPTNKTVDKNFGAGNSSEADRWASSHGLPRQSDQRNWHTQLQGNHRKGGYMTDSSVGDSSNEWQTTQGHGSSGSYASDGRQFTQESVDWKVDPSKRMGKFTGDAVDYAQHSTPQHRNWPDQRIECQNTQDISVKNFSSGDDHLKSNESRNFPFDSSKLQKPSSENQHFPPVNFGGSSHNTNDMRHSETKSVAASQPTGKEFLHSAVTVQKMEPMLHSPVMKGRQNSSSLKNYRHATFTQSTHRREGDSSLDNTVTTSHSSTESPMSDHGVRPPSYGSEQYTRSPIAAHEGSKDINAASNVPFAYDSRMQPDPTIKLTEPVMSYNEDNLKVKHAPKVDSAYDYSSTVNESGRSGESNAKSVAQGQHYNNMNTAPAPPTSSSSNKKGRSTKSAKQDTRSAMNYSIGYDAENRTTSVTSPVQSKQFQNKSVSIESLSQRNTQITNPVPEHRSPQGPSKSPDTYSSPGYSHHFLGAPGYYGYGHQGASPMLPFGSSYPGGDSSTINQHLQKSMHAPASHAQDRSRSALENTTDDKGKPVETPSSSRKESGKGSDTRDSKRETKPSSTSVKEDAKSVASPGSTSGSRSGNNSARSTPALPSSSTADTATLSQTSPAPPSNFSPYSGSAIPGPVSQNPYDSVLSSYPSTSQYNLSTQSAGATPNPFSTPAGGYGTPLRPPPTANSVSPYGTPGAYGYGASSTSQYDSEYARASMYSAFHRPEPHHFPAPPADLGSPFLPSANPPFGLPPHHTPPAFPTNPGANPTPNFYPQNVYATNPYAARPTYGAGDPSYAVPYGTPAAGFSPFLNHLPGSMHQHPYAALSHPGTSPAQPPATAAATSSAAQAADRPAQ